MKVNDQKYKEIIDYISGELNEPDKKEMETWIHSSEMNRETYEKILKKNWFLRWSYQSEKFDRDVELRKFRRKMNSGMRNATWISVAASVVLIVGLSVPYFWNQDRENEEMLVSSTSILPGKKGAQLILSTGEWIEIEDQAQKIQEKNGTFIHFDLQKGLQYAKHETKSKSLIFNTLKVPRGNEFALQLADGTKVWLNADSELKYPVHFIGNNNREVFLKGEAYFEVKHNKEKAFVVNAYNQQVKVYGTEFCVNAYDKKQIKTILLEGSVGIKIGKQGSELKLKPSELGLADLKTRKIEIKKVNPRPYVAWKEGAFVFKNESLENIMLRLERWYNVKVFYRNESCKNLRFSGDMERYSDVNDLLYFIQESADVKFEINGKTIIIMSK